VTRHAQDGKRRPARGEGNEQQQQEATAPDLRDGQLDEDVACCLAEIDKILDGESERDRAVREFRELRGTSDWDDLARAERVWQAQYAHLGLRITSGCCTIALIDEKTGKTVERL